jgi:uridine kinase
MTVRAAGSEPEAMTPIAIGVSGGTGSGKTTVANEILRRVGPRHIVHLNQDRYYRDLDHLSEDERIHHNFDHPSAIEESLLIEHLQMLKAGRAARVPVYDFTRHLRTSEVEVLEPRPVILLEGILILAIAEIRELLDVKIFVDTDADVRFIRRLKRDMAERGRSVDNVITQYVTTVRPMHLEFVEPSKRWADLIIPEGGFNKVALELVISRIQALVGGSG